MRKPSKQTAYAQRVRTYERNILRTLAKATPDDIASGVRWYADARCRAYGIAAAYSLPGGTHPRNAIAR